MSEEEKRAIETLEEVASDDFDTLGDDISPKMAQNILNVINKQQKEIAEKTTIIMAGAEKVKQLEKEIKEMREELQMYVDVQNNDIHNYISKDKIREKIKELEEKSDYWNCDEIQVLQELLEDK